MLKKILFILLSSILLLLVLLMSFWLSLSEEKLLAWSRHSINRSLPRQIRVEITGLHTRFWGLEIDQIEMTNRAQGKSFFKATGIQVRFDPVALIIRQELPFSFKLYGGEGEGALGYLPGLRVKLSASNMELNWIPVIRQTKLLKSSPKVYFNSEFSLKSNTGSVNLEIKNLIVTGNKTHTTLTVNLPDTELAHLKADLKIANNQLGLSIDTAGDITANLSGKILGDWRRIRKSKIDVTLSGDMNAAYRARLGIFNNIIDSYRSKSGRISIRLTGNLMLPQIRKI